jgi:hypothetical protein
VLHDAEEVAPLQRIAAGQDDVRRAVRRNLIEDLIDLDRLQLPRTGVRVGVRATVGTREVAGACQLPVNTLRRVVESMCHGVPLCNCGA